VEIRSTTANVGPARRASIHNLKNGHSMATEYWSISAASNALVICEVVSF